MWPRIAFKSRAMRGISSAVSSRFASSATRTTSSFVTTAPSPITNPCSLIPNPCFLKVYRGDRHPGDAREVAGEDVPHLRQWLHPLFARNDDAHDTVFVPHDLAMPGQRGAAGHGPRRSQAVEFGQRPQ